MHKRYFLGLVVGSLLVAGQLQLFAKEPIASPKHTLTMVVMDPLAAPLSCPCVEGYAQRKYEILAAFLEKKTDEKVKVVFSESLETALKGDANGTADLIIGKDSVVRADAKDAKMIATPIARLTGKEGKTTQTGLMVVRSDDPAQSVKDIAGYKIFFGPSECAEKHRAAFDLLKSAKIAIPQKLHIDQACSDGASKVVELGQDGKSAAVISSYAAPLLEGCGTIKKGDLKVIGETKPVPFVTAFTTESLNKQRRQKIQQFILESAEHPDLLIALESLIGFVPVEEPTKVAVKKN